MQTALTLLSAIFFNTPAHAQAWSHRGPSVPAPGKQFNQRKAPKLIDCTMPEWIERFGDRITDHDEEWYAPKACSPSSAPLFQNSDPNDVLFMSIHADFEALNQDCWTGNEAALEKCKDLTKQKAVLGYHELDGNWKEIKVGMQGRGNSRFDHCAMRPFKLKLNEEDQVNSLFSNMDDTLKFTTHCGTKDKTTEATDIYPFTDTSQWESEGGSFRDIGTPEEQQRWLLQEYYLYKTLTYSGSTNLDVRLVYIFYYDVNSGFVTSDFAFIREHEKDLADRCDLVESETKQLATRPTQLFQAELQHRFVTNHDYSWSANTSEGVPSALGLLNGPVTPEQETVSFNNFKRFAEDNTYAHYAPYDFDLAAMMHPEYGKNDGDPSLDTDLNNFQTWLDEQVDQRMVQLQSYYLLLDRTLIEDMIDGSYLDDSGYEHLNHWFDRYANALACRL